MIMHPPKVKKNTVVKNIVMTHLRITKLANLVPVFHILLNLEINKLSLKDWMVKTKQNTFHNHKCLKMIWIQK
jgi:hypothetical protein